MYVYFVKITFNNQTKIIVSISVSAYINNFNRCGKETLIKTSQRRRYHESRQRIAICMDYQ